MLDNKEITRAGFGPRAAAFIADGLIVFLALLFVRLPVFFASMFTGDSLTGKAFLFHYSFLDVLCWVLTVLYFILLTYFTGSTLGKKLMRLRVEREDGEPLRLIDVIYRETVGRFLSGILCLGYFMILADRDKRAFHDWLCGTRVIYEGVAFRPREAKTAPAYSVPSAHVAPDSAPSGYSVPGSTPSGYSVPGSTSSGYSIPGSTPSGYSVPGSTPAAPVLPDAAPETRVIPDAAPDLTRPFPAEEPIE